MYKKILVGYDGSDGSKRALEHAIHLTQEHDGELWTLWVRGSLPHYPETIDEIEEEKEAADSYLQNLMGEVAAYSKQFNIEIHGDTKSGHVAKTIVDYAKEGGFELIVIGHSGHSGLWGHLLGHTADKVSETAHCSVLIVR